MREALARHWPEYLIEAAALGLFMVSACVVTALLEHPASPLHHAIENATLRRTIIGIAMGLTAIALIYSPFGRRSGAHMNPAVTLTFLRLAKIAPVDAVGYLAAQFIGAALGVALCVAVLGTAIVGDPAVNYVVTVPGMQGIATAFAAEVVISALLMTAVLMVSNRPSINRYTGVVAGLLVALYITVEAPLSGMSMNPARTLGSAIHAARWDALWIYFTAPLLGMLLAAEGYVRAQGARAVLCCKLHHDNDERCIFRCGYPQSCKTAPASDDELGRRAAT